MGFDCAMGAIVSCTLKIKLTLYIHCSYLLVFAAFSCVVTGFWNSQMNPLMTSRCTILPQVTARCQISFPALKGVAKDRFTLGLAQWKSWGFSQVLIALSFLVYLTKVLFNVERKHSCNYPPIPISLKHGKCCAETFRTVTSTVSWSMSHTLSSFHCANR